MKKSKYSLLLSFSLSSLVLFSGCAYYNTFYNMKKEFKAAEKETRNAQEQQSQSTQTGQPRPSQTTVTGGYQKVIESGSSLLENFPKSRWIDDTLLLMGISYFRLGEHARAERKFNELLTIFPDSRHVDAATIWKAQALAIQKNEAKAEEVLIAAIPRLNSDKYKATAYMLLGDIHFKKENWSDAATEYRLAADLTADKIERNTALYQLGLCEYELKNFEAARDAFRAVAASARSSQRAYQAQLYMARSELALEQFDEAQQTLQNLRRDRRYEVFLSEIDLELADFKIRSGNTDDGISAYQEYLRNYESGAGRGTAYFRLGLIHRDLMRDLTSAKLYFDSVAASGADRALTDSAAAESSLLTRGLLAFSNIKSIADSLETAGAELDSLRNIQSLGSRVLPDSAIETQALEEFSSDTATHVVTDSLIDPSVTADENVLSDTVSLDTVIQVSKLPSDTLVKDSIIATEQETAMDTTAGDSVAKPSRRVTPATHVADSILRALALADSTLPDTLHLAQIETPAAMDTLVDPVTQRIAILETSIPRLEQNLQTAYLNVAEFYGSVLHEPDSALAYYRLAAKMKTKTDLDWKANLQLAYALEGDGEIFASERESAFYAVIHDETAPIEVKNIARKALNLPLEDLPTPPQVFAFQTAESLFISGAPMDTVIQFYSTVATMDSTTSEGIKSLLALSYFYEYIIYDTAAAMSANEALIRLAPDSSFTPILKKKIEPPDENSIFLLSDDEMLARTPVTMAISAEPDSTGWPPAEETLQGRRFR